MIVMANDIVWILLALMACFWFMGRETDQRLVFYAGLTSAVALLGDILLSPIINHPRPFVALGFHPLIPHAVDPSFPSSHATLAFAIAFAVWFVKRRWGTAMIALAILTGVARVYVGVHYPADIIGAAVLSFLSACVVLPFKTRIDPIPSWIIKTYRKLTERVPFIPHPE